MTEPTVRVSNWTKAAITAEIRCPNAACSASNRPGVHFIDTFDDGARYCTSCSHSWNVKTEAKLMATVVSAQDAEVQG